MAQSDQIISIVDNYAYRPLVRQASSQGYFYKVFNLGIDHSELEAGLRASPKVLAAIDDLISEQGILKSGMLLLSDIHFDFHDFLFSDGDRRCKIASIQSCTVSLAGCDLYAARTLTLKPLITSNQTDASSRNRS